MFKHNDCKKYEDLNFSNSNNRDKNSSDLRLNAFKQSIHKSQILKLDMQDMASTIENWWDKEKSSNNLSFVFWWPDKYSRLTMFICCIGFVLYNLIMNKFIPLTLAIAANLSLFFWGFISGAGA